MPRVTYTADEIKTVRARLAAREPPPKTEGFSAREVVEQLADVIEAMIAKGFNVKQIAEALQESGMRIGDRTLRDHLRRANMQRNRRSATRRSRSHRGAASRVTGGPQRPDAAANGRGDGSQGEGREDDGGNDPEAGDDPGSFTRRPKLR